MKKKIQKNNKDKVTSQTTFVNTHIISTLEEQKNTEYPKHYEFYENYHDSSYIEFHGIKSNVKLKEPRESRKYSLCNDIKKDLVVYKIDGGLFKSQAIGDTKCDYGIYTEDELLILVELKGGNYKKAVQQITNTTKLLGLNGSNKIKRLIARTVLSNGRKVPNITERDLAALKQLISKYNCLRRPKFSQLHRTKSVTHEFANLISRQS